MRSSKLLQAPHFDSLCSTELKHAILTYFVGQNCQHAVLTYFVGQNFQAPHFDIVEQNYKHTILTHFV